MLKLNENELDFKDDEESFESKLTDLPKSHLYFVCQECGIRLVRRRPKMYKAYQCPKCKSEALMPEGM